MTTARAQRTFTSHSSICEVAQARCNSLLVGPGVRMSAFWRWFQDLQRLPWVVSWLTRFVLGNRNLTLNLGVTFQPMTKVSVKAIDFIDLLLTLNFVPCIHKTHALINEVTLSASQTPHQKKVERGGKRCVPATLSRNVVVCGVKSSFLVWLQV